MAELRRETEAGDERKRAEAAAASRRKHADPRKPQAKKEGSRRGDSEVRYGSDGGGSLIVSSSGSLASSSRGRCSSGSDLDALFSLISPHLAGRDRGSGPHRFVKKQRLSGSNQGAEVEEEEQEQEANHSFSIALQECQNRRSRPKSPEFPSRGRSRTSSLDLHSPGADAHGVPVMKKSSEESVRRKLGVFPSPCTPYYRHEKGWSSERVPLHSNSIKRHVSSSALLPFHNGRTVPSKWEDAEKWIVSPVPNNSRPAGMPPHHRRPKSKSGPLSSPFEMGFSSPPIPIFGKARNFPDNSPFMTGVLLAPSERDHDKDAFRMKKDAATQMSPNESSASSLSSPRIEERDVQVDERVTVTRWTKKNLPRGIDKKKTLSPEEEKFMSKSKREAERITAWENLQQVKAEAAIRKLEARLEKKRASSMEKIMKRLKNAQKKGMDMRSALASQEERKSGRIGRRGGRNACWSCFSCHVF